MSGFSNPIVDATGNLQIQSVQSPGFSLGPPIVGWQIDKNGQAFFQTVSIGSGVQKIFYQGTAPTSPPANTNDFWVNTASNNALSIWNGSAWVAVQWGTNALAPGAVTLSVLAAGIVYAGIINGTTVTGAKFIDTGGGYFGYTASPAANNMFYSDSPISGTDSVGNAFLAGVTFYGLAATGVWIAVNFGVTNAAFGPVYYTASSEAGPWGIDSWLRRSSGTAGQLEIGPLNKILSTPLLPPTPSDGATLWVPSTTITPRIMKLDGEPGYGIGETIYSTNSDQTISAAWAVPIAGGGISLSVPVVAGLVYYFEGTFWVNLSASFQIDLGVTGPAINNAQWFFQGHTSPTIIPLTALTFVAPTPPAAGDYLAKIWGTFNPSANGTFSMGAGKVANNFTVKAGTELHMRTHH